jgi:hypothetical protein
VYSGHATTDLGFLAQAEKVTSLMHEGQLANGLWNTVWDIGSGMQVNGASHSR